MRILIIDDERAIRNSLKEVFEMNEYEVDTAESGQDGLQAASKEKYDAILCDIKMPGMDGNEVLDALQQEGIESPVIMISGHADIDTAVACIRSRKGP